MHIRQGLLAAVAAEEAAAARETVTHQGEGWNQKASIVINI